MFSRCHHRSQRGAADDLAEHLRQTQVVTAENKAYSLLQQPGPQKYKLSQIELIYKAKKFKVPPFTI